MLKQFLLPSIPVDQTGEATRLVRMGSLAMALFFGGLGIWAVTAPLAGAIVAGGNIKIDSHRKTVQHFDGGIVKEILVREGSEVKAGQAMLVLEDALTRSSMNILDTQLRIIQVREARLFAERALSESLRFSADILEDNSPKTQEIVAAEKALFRTRRKSLDDQIRLLREEIAHARQAAVELGREIQSIREGIDFAERQLAATRKLLDKHYVQESEIWRLESEVAEKKERLGARLAALSQEREQISDLELQIITAKNTYVAEADTELKDLKKERVEVEEKLRPARDAVKRQVISAPVDGQVIDLKVTTLGGVVKSGDALMDIVPTSRDMLMEVKVKNNDVDSIHIDQDADVQLSAFNARTTPLVKGKVVYVSGDALLDEVNHEYYYLAHIRVTQEDLKSVADLPLSPGMPITAFIKTTSRTFSEYLLAPVVERVRQAVREE